MGKRIWIFTGGRPSNSAQSIADHPNFRRYIVGKSFKSDHVLVNWGTQKVVGVGDAKVLNPVAAIGIAANKLFAFTAFAGENIDTVPWTANKAIAQEWQDKGNTVVVRNVLTGHSGNGILIIEEGEVIPDAPLYTRYVFKTKEFRVHATQTEVIDTQRKVRDPDVEPLSWKVRSHANGFIFQRNNIEPNEARDKLAMASVKALSLDFGAVDIIEDKKGKLYVLEVNTAPGLEGQTVEAYTTVLEKLANAPI
jgi:glutathione synthase/RimK-type ligase-like ATP-grasp enzyme